MSMALNADYGDRVYAYKLKYSGDMTSGSIEILEPASIAGLTVQVSPDGTSLIYEDVTLDTGARCV